MAPRQELRGRVDDHVGALVEPAQVDGRGDRGIADDERGLRPAAGSQSGTVSSGFAGASTQTMSASAGGGPGVVAFMELEDPRAERRKEDRRPEVRALGERDLRPGPGEGGDDRRRRGRPRCEEQGVSALEGAELLLARGARRMGIARVEEVPRLAALVVRPDGGAVHDHHLGDATGAAAQDAGAERA